jgi:ribosome-associated translation inhibitor RaiA
MTQRDAGGLGGVQVTVSGDLSAGAAAEARRRVASLSRYTRTPITYARIRLTRVPAVERPVIAQANLSVDGRTVRARVAARTVREAIDRLQPRLRRQLLQLASRRTQRRHGSPHRSWSTG